MTDYRDAADEAALKTYEGITGTIKWYNEGKGYGFLVPDEGQGISDDIALNHAILEARGIVAVYEGQRIRCDVETSPKGLRVSETEAFALLEPIVSTPDFDIRRTNVDTRGFSVNDMRVHCTVLVAGYDLGKGYGFVHSPKMRPDDKRGHAFLHATVLHAMGIDPKSLYIGQKLVVDIWTRSPHANGFMALPRGYRDQLLAEAKKALEEAQRPKPSTAGEPATRGAGLGSDK